MTLAQTAPKPATTIKIWEDASPHAAVGDIIRKPFCPIARVVDKEILADGRTCLIVTFPGCHDRHVEEWVLETPAVLEVAATPKTTTPAPTAIGINGDEPPNRGDNGRGRMQPAKKLMLSIVPVKRITNDVPTCNFDPNELEIAGELSLAHGGFIIPRRWFEMPADTKLSAATFSFTPLLKGPAVKPTGRRNNIGASP